MSNEDQNVQLKGKDLLLFQEKCTVYPCYICGKANVFGGVFVINEEDVVSFEICDKCIFNLKDLFKDRALNKYTPPYKDSETDKTLDCPNCGDAPCVKSCKYYDPEYDD